MYFYWRCRKKTSCSPKLKATFFVRAALSNADFCQLSVQFCFIQERQEIERQVQGTDSREQCKRGQCTVVGHGQGHNAGTSTVFLSHSLGSYAKRRYIGITNENSWSKLGPIRVEEVPVFWLWDARREYGQIHSERWKKRLCHQDFLKSRSWHRSTTFGIMLHPLKPCSNL